jgi:hypothetical protein
VAEHSFRHSDKPKDIGEGLEIQEWVSEAVKVGIPTPPGQRTVVAELEGISVTVENPDGRMRRFDKALQDLGAEPQEVSLLVGKHHIFAWDLDGYICTAKYRVKLQVRVHGGNVGTPQLTKALQPGTSHEFRDRWIRDGTSPTVGAQYRDKDGANVLEFVWPEEIADCGWRTVRINLPSEFPEGWQVVPASLQQNDQLREGETTQFVFVISIYLTGSYPTPEKKSKGPTESTNETSFQETSAPDLEADWPSDTATPLDNGFSFQRAISSGLLGALEAMGEGGIDPSESVDRGGIGDLGRIPSAPSASPPWTQLDIQVDPDGSVDARDSVQTHDIDGPRIVRGVFNGHQRSFIEGPRIPKA